MGADSLLVFYSQISVIAGESVRGSAGEDSGGSIQNCTRFGFEAGPGGRVSKV